MPSREPRIPFRPGQLARRVRRRPCCAAWLAFALLIGPGTRGARADAPAGVADVVIVPEDGVVPDGSYEVDPAAERARLAGELALAEERRAHVTPRLGRAVAGLVLDVGLIVGAVYLGRYVQDHACADLAAAEAAGAPIDQTTNNCERGTRIGVATTVALGAALGVMNVVRIVVHAVRRARANTAVDTARLRLEEFERPRPPTVDIDVGSDGHGAYGVFVVHF